MTPAMASFPLRAASILDAAPTGLTLRPATDDDMAFLRQLYAASRHDEMAAVPWPDAAREAFLASQFALQHAHYLSHYACAAFLIVMEGTRPIGRLYVDERERDLHVIDISLTLADQGHGWGSALMRVLMRQASARGKGVTLQVSRFNPCAHALYRRLGFIEAPGGDAAYLPMRWVS
ncbi:GNAT family N-acetyltransferase [Luteibacter sahnii]|nr:GNAT family N-acetyltransferase [Luteibacter sp. PPL193]